MRAFEIHAARKLPPSPYAIPPGPQREVRWRRWLVLALLPLVGFLRGKSTADKQATPDANESFEQWKRQIEAARPHLSHGIRDHGIG